MKSILKKALEAAYLGGLEIMDVYNSDFAVETKDDKSPLTLADTLSHELLQAGLQALTPAVPILSEESSPGALAGRRPAGDLD